MNNQQRTIDKHKQMPLRISNRKGKRRNWIGTFLENGQTPAVPTVPSVATAAETTASNSQHTEPKSLEILIDRPTIAITIRYKTLIRQNNLIEWAQLLAQLDIYSCVFVHFLHHRRFRVESWPGVVCDCSVLSTMLHIAQCIPVFKATTANQRWHSTRRWQRRWWWCERPM